MHSEKIDLKFIFCLLLSYTFLIFQINYLKLFFRNVKLITNILFF